MFPEGSGAGISTPSASADPLLAGAGTAASAVVGCSRERARAASSALADIAAGSRCYPRESSPQRGRSCWLGRRRDAWGHGVALLLFILITHYAAKSDDSQTHQVSGHFQCPLDLPFSSSRGPARAEPSHSSLRSMEVLVSLGGIGDYRRAGPTGCQRGPCWPRSAYVSMRSRGGRGHQI